MRGRKIGNFARIIGARARRDAFDLQQRLQAMSASMEEVPWVSADACEQLIPKMNLVDDRLLANFILAKRTAGEHVLAHTNIILFYAVR